MNLELEVDNQNWSGWPAVLVSEGVNLVPNGTNHILMGATLEPGTYGDPKSLEEMKNMNKKAPDWIHTSTVIEQWSGLRGRPKDKPAPLLKKLEPGLIMATGHYRNGILLAPASAEWVANAISDDHTS